MNRLFLIWVILGFCPACTENKPQEQAEEAASIPPQYYYYPRANVYFDSTNKDYLFLGTDGKTWQAAKAIPAVVQSLMDKNIFIQQPADPVWKDNENHKLVYSALLYATPNDTIQKKVAKPVTKAVPPGPDTTVVEEKKKKGLGKFFDKLFGRNKKQKEKADSIARSQ